MSIPKGATHIDSTGVCYHERGDGQFLYFSKLTDRWVPSPAANRGEIDLRPLRKTAHSATNCADLPVTPEEEEAWEEGERRMRQIASNGSTGEHYDPVNHPDHYTQGGIECIDAIEAALTPEEFRGYCKGNALKYVWRERRKGGEESIAKAEWYLNRL